jgi:hypothetical protein
MNFFTAFDGCVEKTPIDYENNMNGKSFRLYGEDLRCLDSGKPMMAVFEYESDIQDTITRAKIELEKILKSPKNQEENCIRTKRIGKNEFIYDSNADVNHYFETTNETDPIKIFNAFDRTEHLIKCFFSNKSPILVIVWSHAIFDGITAQWNSYKMLGKEPYPNQPMQHPNLLTKKLCLARTILDLPNIGVSSQLSEYKDLDDPTFITTQLSIANTKQIKNEESVTFASVTTSKFLENCFKSLPDSVSQLKTFISVYIDNPNRFNNYSIIPIIVHRNKCTPKDINTLFVENKFHVFGFYELFRTDLMTNMKSNMTTMFVPDVIISSMRNNDEGGDAKLKRILVLNFSSKAKIYGCGIQCGPDTFYIQSSIRTSAIDLEKYKSHE